MLDEFPITNSACMRLVCMSLLMALKLFGTGKFFVADLTRKVFFGRMRILHVASEMGGPLETLRTLFAMIRSRNFCRVNTEISSIL